MAQNPVPMKVKLPWDPSLEAPPEGLQPLEIFQGPWGQPIPWARALGRGFSPRPWYPAWDARQGSRCGRGVGRSEGRGSVRCRSPPTGDQDPLKDFVLFLPRALSRQWGWAGVWQQGHDLNLVHIHLAQQRPVTLCPTHHSTDPHSQLRAWWRTAWGRKMRPEPSTEQPGS